MKRDMDGSCSLGILANQRLDGMQLVQLSLGLQHRKDMVLDVNACLCRSIKCTPSWVLVGMYRNCLVLKSLVSMFGEYDGHKRSF